MKKFLLSLIVTLFFIDNVSAQLFAYAGDDYEVCDGEDVNLGGFPTADGGTPPYTYVWSPGDDIDSTAENPIFSSFNLGSFTFTLIVTDALGAQAFDTITVGIMPNPIANAGINNLFMCAGDDVTLGGSPTASGGSGPYEYFWFPATGLNDDLSSNPTASPTTSISYQLEVMDANGCIAIDVATVVVAPCGNFFVNTIDASCAGACDGSAEITPPGNYHYLWNDGDTSANRSNMCAGNYSVVIMDSVMNPLDTLPVAIVQPAQLVVIPFETPISCAGGSDGSIFLSVTGGTPPYSFAWNDGVTTSNRSNLVAGIYTVTVWDGSACSVSAGSSMFSPPPITLGILTNEESAPAACDGSIDITVGGGVAPYAYTWSNGAVTEDISNLCQGTYSLTITDANGCTFSGATTVGAACPNNTIVLSITSTGDIDCNRVADTLTAVVSGGTPPYSFLWNTGETTQTIETMLAGNYRAYVTDAAGCTRDTLLAVNNYGVNVTLQSATPVACNGTPNGKIKINVNGGVPPYTYLWNTGSTADSIVNVPSANYRVTVSDAASCTVVFSYFLNQVNTNWSYYVYLNTTQANCGSNGTATAIVQGGVPPYTYLWNTTPPQTTQTVTGLASGSVSVTVADNNGCIRYGSATVYTSCSNVISGYLYNDANGNCLKDPGETAIANRNVEASGTGGFYYGYSNTNGFYSIRVNSSGTYNVNSYSQNWGGNSCAAVAACGTNTVTFSSVGDTVSRDFGFSSGSGFDLSLHPGWNGANPGFDKNYHVLYHQTNEPLYNGAATIVFRYDSILIYNSNNNNGVHNANARTITWQVNSVPYPSWDWDGVPRAYFTVPVNTPVGYQLSQEFWLNPTSGDCDTLDNYLRIIQPVTGSMDPNEKQVEPAGDILEEDSVLTYTIHFQNTGNDTTWFIILKDTLSQYVNPASVKNISSSHPYTSFEVTDQGILTWLFNPIFLVDSATNEAESKGYVMFKVKKKANLPLTTQISNKASIYFDYNEPIVTNTVMNTITEPNFIFTIRRDDISVTAMPNPFSASTQIVVEGITTAYDFELFDVTGKMLRKIPSINESSFELNRDDLSAGVYFYRITTATKQRTFGRLVAE